MATKPLLIYPSMRALLTSTTWPPAKANLVEPRSPTAALHSCSAVTQDGAAAHSEEACRRGQRPNNSSVRGAGRFVIVPGNWGEKCEVFIPFTLRSEMDSGFFFPAAPSRFWQQPIKRLLCAFLPASNSLAQTNLVFCHCICQSSLCFFLL